MKSIELFYPREYPEISISLVKSTNNSPQKCLKTNNNLDCIKISLKEQSSNNKEHSSIEKSNCSIYQKTYDKCLSPIIRKLIGKFMDSNLKTNKILSYTPVDKKQNLQLSDENGENFDCINLNLKLDTDEKSEGNTQNTGQNKGNQILIENIKPRERKTVSKSPAGHERKLTKRTVSSKEDDYLSFDLSENENSKERSPEILTKIQRISAEKKKVFANRKSISASGFTKSGKKVMNLKNSKSVCAHTVNFYKKKASQSSLNCHRNDSASKDILNSSERPSISNAGINLRNDSSTKIYSR